MALTTTFLRGHLSLLFGAETAQTKTYPLYYLMQRLCESSNSVGVRFRSATKDSNNNDVYYYNTTSTSVSCTVSQNLTTSEYTITGIYTITNGTSNDITIDAVEVRNNGPYTYWSSGTRYNTSSVFTMDTTVLDSPITIPANGGVGQVTYTLVMDYPDE